MSRCPCARPSETIMAQPGPNSAIDNAAQGDSRMQPEHVGLAVCHWFLGLWRGHSWSMGFTHSNEAVKNGWFNLSDILGQSFALTKFPIDRHIHQFHTSMRLPQDHPSCHEEWRHKVVQGGLVNVMSYIVIYYHIIILQRTSSFQYQCKTASFSPRHFPVAKNKRWRIFETPPCKYGFEGCWMLFLHTSTQKCTSERMERSSCDMRTAMSASTGCMLVPEKAVGK